MAKKLIKEIRPYVKLYRDTNNGIAWIEDGSTGLGISVHPNLDKSGSVTGMKKLGYWDKSDRIVLSHGWKYNIDRFVCDKKNDLEMIVADECMCRACLKRRGIMETFFFHQDIIIITANAAGEKYLIKAKSIQDILDDWNGDCEFVPSNDACVFYTEWNGRPINPAGYTDFGTLIEYLKGLQKRESGV